ncbi:MAG: ABC transporter ATP-binding protein/permease [Candidatus Pacebacteria bacterium]|nr:ABC transporter ATP-binding protein/permease [Candidatus Paceibacterota bacterium]
MFKVYKTYYQFLFAYKRQFVVFVFFLVGLGFFESIQPYFYKLFIDAIPSGDFSVLLNILFAYVGVRVLKLVFDVITYFTGDNILLRSARDARLKVFRKIQDLDFAFHLTKSTGSMISSIKRGDGAFFGTFHILNIHLMRVLINFIVVFFFLLRADIMIGLIMFGAFGINFVIAMYLIRNNIGARKAFNKAEDNTSAVIVDNLLNFETVKLFAKEDKELSRLKNVFKPWLNRLWEYANSFRVIDIVVGGIGNIGIFAVLLYGLNIFSQGKITGGEFVMIIGFISTFYYRFFELVFELRNLAKNQTDLQKYFEPLKHETIVKDPIKPVVPKEINGHIEFRDLNFSYPEGKQDALVDVNLTIQPGESIAFVGHSGAGKTTIMKLIMRFFDVTSGQILLDGIDIRDMRKDTLRSFMGVVPQEPLLFNNTIEYNIAYGAEKVTKEEIQSAVKMANLDEFIDSMPNGLQTNVGERGIKLSGGQKQRLAIARMILADPRIIVFDEATSQLDSQSEKKIQDAFWKSSKDKTTLIVAHRLSTVVKADKIVVMEGGSIVEVGTHQELLKNKNGLYSHFWKLQTMEEEK